MSGPGQLRRLVPKGPKPTVIGIVKSETATQVTLETSEELASKQPSQPTFLVLKVVIGFYFTQIQVPTMWTPSRRNHKMSLKEKTRASKAKRGKSLENRWRLTSQTSMRSTTWCRRRTPHCCGTLSKTGLRPGRSKADVVNAIF